MDHHGFSIVSTSHGHAKKKPVPCRGWSHNPSIQDYYLLKLWVFPRYIPFLCKSLAVKFNWCSARRCVVLLLKHRVNGQFGNLSTHLDSFIPPEQVIHEYFFSMVSSVLLVLSKVLSDIVTSYGLVIDNCSLKLKLIFKITYVKGETVWWLYALLPRDGMLLCYIRSIVLITCPFSFRQNVMLAAYLSII